MSTDLKHSVFYRPSGLVDASNVPTINPCRQSISTILLLTIRRDGANAVGLLHPEAAYPFNPAWFPKVPYVTFKNPATATNIATEWIPGDPDEREVPFRHRRIR